MNRTGVILFTIGVYLLINGAVVASTFLPYVQGSEFILSAICILANILLILFDVTIKMATDSRIGLQIDELTNAFVFLFFGSYPLFICTFAKYFSDFSDIVDKVFPAFLAYIIYTTLCINTSLYFVFRLALNLSKKPFILSDMDFDMVTK